MAISRGLQMLVVALAISSTLTTPLKRSKGKLARQIEFTTPLTVVEQRTGYPGAGFRPKIPFDLPNEKPEQVTESVEVLPISPTASTLEDFDEAVSKTVKSVETDHTPADTYGAPLPTADDTIEIEAKLVPAPAEDFQPPSEEATQDFLSSFNVIDNNAGDVVADLPAFEQASETEDLDVTNNKLPPNTYGAPEVKLSKPKTDVETIDDQQQQEGIESAEAEGSAESELGLASESGIHEPADAYGAPRTELDEDNEIESELAEVEQQLEILSRLTRMKTGRLVILPIENNLYLGRLVSSQPKRVQRKNGRLQKL